MIEVFKTNVSRKSEARKVVSALLEHYPCSKINFDLQDCDRILRVEGEELIVEQVMKLVNENGFSCTVLE